MSDQKNLQAANAEADKLRDDVAPDNVTEPCPLLANTAWIEIQLVGEDDAPIKNSSYEIIAPDGETFTGKTNSHGKARLEAIPEGKCQVSFPDLDADAWEVFN